MDDHETGSWKEEALQTLEQLRAQIIAAPDDQQIPPDQSIYVSTGDEFQAALNNAVPGQKIVLMSDQVYRGNFVLPKKPPGEVIEVIGSDDDFIEGTRVTANSILWPKIITPNSQPAIRADFGASNWIFRGIEITCQLDTTDRIQFGLIVFGIMNDKAASSPEELPDNVSFDQCYIHGTPTGNCKRGIALNTRRANITNCLLTEFHLTGFDSQAICGWNALGPIKITNNLIEAAGENIMFGGGTSMTDAVPTGIVVYKNTIRKPDRWRKDHPEFAGIDWSCKNLFELKNAQDVHLIGNELENSWIGSQHGAAILLTVRTEDGRMPWATVNRVRILDNVIRRAGIGVHILSNDAHPGQETRDILIQNNLLVDVNKESNGRGTFLLLTGGGSRGAIRNLEVRGNTFDHNGNGSTFIAMGDRHGLLNGFDFVENIATSGDYGIHGSDKGVGIPSLNHYAKDWKVHTNVFIDNGTLARYKDKWPPGNVWEESLSSAGVDVENGYTLVPGSSYIGAAQDGGPLGFRPR